MVWERVVVDDAQRRLLAVVLRQFHVALKTFGLYSAEHAVAQSVLPGVSATIQNYLRLAGPLTIQVGRDRLDIAGETLQEGGAASLAYYLYLRSVASLAMLPGVAERELGVLLSALSRDRQTLDAIGGIERALAGQDLPHIVVAGVTLSHDPGATERDALAALLNGDRLSAEQRDLVLDVLRDSPEATARLLVALHQTASESGERPVLPSMVQALDTLDRTILDELLEDQEALFATLAQAHMLLDEPLRSQLARELLGRAADGGAARTLVSELSSQEIAQLLLGLSEREALAGQISDFLAQLTFLPDKLPEVVAALQPALAARGVPIEAPPQSSRARPADGAKQDGWSQIPPGLLELQPGEERALLRDVEELTEPHLVAHAVTTLSNLLFLEEEPEQLVETANILAGYLPALANAGRLDLVASGLRALGDAADRAGPHRAGVEGAIARLLDQGVLDVLVAAGLREGDPVAASGRQALRQIASDAVPRITWRLEREPQATRRRQLCRLLVDVARGAPDLIGMHLPSRNWYLTRNLVFVLGELRDPDGVRHIVRVSRSDDFRVRREIIDALRKIGGPEGRTALLGFFDDPEPRIRHHLIETIQTEEDGQVAQLLLRVVTDGDVSPRAAVLKIAAMKALERMHAQDALPVIRRLARPRWVFGKTRRTVRDAARRIAATWEASSAR